MASLYAAPHMYKIIQGSREQFLSMSNIRHIYSGYTPLVEEDNVQSNDVKITLENLRPRTSAISNVDTVARETKIDATFSNRGFTIEMNVGLPKNDSKTYICMEPMGRFGNEMFCYASAYGIARSKGMILLYYTTNKRVGLRDAFPYTTAIKHTTKCPKTNSVRNKKDSAFTDRDVAFTNATNITLTGRFQSWKFFKNYFSDIRREFRFNNDVLRETDSVIHNVLGKLNYSSEVINNLTYIAIHVRRGDMLSKPHLVKMGYLTPGPKYYHKAMEWYRKLYNPILFLVLSEQWDFPSKHLNFSDVMFMPGNKPVVDMAVMSRCNHTIMSVGTFGWWGSFLSSGHTIAYKYPAREKSSLGNQFRSADFFIPEWTLMDDT